MNRRAGSMRASVEASLWGAAVFATDCLPPRIRYGYVHRLTRAILAPPAIRVEAAAAHERAADAVASLAPPGAPTCVLAADRLDVGGIGTVIEMLALGLGRHGVRPVVVCQGDGVRAARLRASGVEVVSVTDEAAARDAIRDAAADVIQSHSAPPFLERAALRSGVPIVPVMHNTEIHYTRARWSSFGALMARSVTGIAVSATVRDFHLRHVGEGTPIVVVPNGAPDAAAPTPTQRNAARARLSRSLGVELSDDVVFVCLARYDSQKNVAGLVAAFGRAVDDSPVPLRLVYAGDPSDPVELRRADALRRSRASGDRIHLVGDSDAHEVLTAADAFVLDSFFEGWPVAASEAAAFDLPVVISDVGGARELVARDPGRSVLVPNATGDAALIDDRRVRSARRRSRHQANAGALRNAIHETARVVLAERAQTSPREFDAGRASASAMVRQHADVIRAAAGVERAAEAARSGGRAGRQ